MMDDALQKAIKTRAQQEPFARTLKMEVLELDDGYSKVGMRYVPAVMDNLFQRAHGGALFALIDEAFEIAAQTGGALLVALNVNVTYMKSPAPDALLIAAARRVQETRKTALFDITITDDDGRMIAICQALAYRTGKPLPFMPAP